MTYTKTTILHTLAVSAALISSAYSQTSFRNAVGEGILDLNFPSADSTILIDTGDFNNDGFKDLLFGFSYTDELFLAALGQGGDQFSIVGPFSSNYNYRAIHAGELTSEGSTEFILRDANNHEVAFYSPQTGITRTEQIEYLSYEATGFFGYSPMITGGDFDGDGLSDIVMNTTNQRVFVRWSSRDQTDPYEEIATPELTNDNILMPIEDYTGDGLLDVLLFDIDSTKFVLIEGTGTNSMGATRVIDMLHPRIAADDYPLFGHFDNQPGLDLVVHDSSVGSASIVLNFTSIAPTPIDISQNEPIIPIGVEGDLDNSGFTDLIVMRPSSVVIGSQSDGSGALLTDPLSGNSILEPMNIGYPDDVYYTNSFSQLNRLSPVLDSIDIDEDGDMDLIWKGSIVDGNKVRVTLNRTDIPETSRFGSSSFEVRSNPLHVLAADLNGDTIDELIVTGLSLGRVYNTQSDMESILIGSSNSFMSAVAHIGSDSQQDIITVGNSPQLRVYPVGADGAVGSPYVYNNPSGTIYQSVVVGDFDGDGQDDLAVNSYDEQITHILRGVDGPALEFWGSIDLNGVSNVKPAVVDFDQDGLVDLAIGDMTNDQIRLYRNNGDGTFTLSNSLAAAYPYWVIAADVDLDGVTDLVSISYSSYPLEMNVLFFDELGQLDQTVMIHTQYHFAEVVADDFTGDELLDLAACALSNPGPSGPSVVWEQTSPRVFEMVATLPTEDASGIAVSDQNGDGALDIITVSMNDFNMMTHWGTPDSCPADFTGDGSLNFFDISAFIQSYGNQDLSADFNSDGLWNFFDISAFLVEFIAGCP